MKNTLKLELKKALKNKFFFIAVLIGCIITIQNVWYFVNMYNNELKFISDYFKSSGIDLSGYSYSTGNSPFVAWVGTEAQSKSSTVLYFILPLLIAIPYGWSYCSERKSGYEKNIIIRSGKINYYLSKYIAIFVSGGLTIVITLLFNFLTLSLFLPLRKPYVGDDIYTGVFPYHIFCSVFYTHPYIYVFFKLLLAFVFCGLIACISYSASLLTKNKVIVTIVPFLFSLVLMYTNGIINVNCPSFNKRICPTDFLVEQKSETTLLIMILLALFLLLLTLGTVFARSKKHEVY